MIGEHDWTLRAPGPMATPMLESFDFVGAVRARVRATPAGPVRHLMPNDHLVAIHTGPPVRVACQQTRSVKTRGAIYVFPAGMSDQWFEDDEGSALELMLPAAFVERVASEQGLDPDRTGIHFLHELRDAQIEHIAYALEAEFGAGSPNGRLYVDSLGVALAVHLLGRYGAPRATTRGGLTRAQLQRVTEYIEAHLDRNLSLARLAAVAGLSTSHFKVSFKQSIGVPVHAHVIRRRVERAKRLLMESDLPSSQIALEAGFSHQSHMARWMRRVLGVTPSAVARRAR